MPIIDAHTHIFPDKVAQPAVEALHEIYGAEPVVLPTAGNLLRHMDASGVDFSVVCPVATKPEHVRSINRWILELPRDRLIPFGALHPACEDNESEIQRLLDGGIKGIKLQPFFQQYTLDAPRTDDLMEQIGDQLLVIMHGGNEIAPQDRVDPTPQRLAAFIDSHPYLRLSIAHLGGYMFWNDVEEYLVGRNVYFDLSYTFGKAPEDQIRRIISGHGYERILFASDFPWQAQSDALAGLSSLCLPPDQEAAILGGNFERAIAMRRPSTEACARTD